MAAKNSEIIELPELKQREIVIHLRGTSPLLMHRFSEKAKRKMLGSMQGEAKSSKHEKRDPVKEYEESMYIRPDGTHGFPALAFKNAVVTAANDAGIQKVLARRAFHVTGPELVKIEGEPRMREDAVTVGRGSADLRYRAEFVEWSTKISLVFNAGVISLEQLLNLFRIAGFGVGVGDWRPEKNGVHGTWEVVEVTQNDSAK
ncbi:MAG: hypothetical protein KDK04_21925 [Candidatus Competibacteraceae bacterium]|nr:hypothetical protein [Candidatus Competibacteraceae bacterium]